MFSKSRNFPSLALWQLLLFFMYPFIYLLCISVPVARSNCGHLFMKDNHATLPSPTAAAGHPVIKFTRAQEKWTFSPPAREHHSQRLQMQWVQPIARPPLEGRKLVRVAGSVRRRPTRPESVPFHRQLNLSGADDSTAPAEQEPPGLTTPPPPHTAGESVWEHRRRAAQQGRVITAAPFKVSRMPRARPSRWSGRSPDASHLPPLSFSSRPGWPNRRVRGVEKAPTTPPPLLMTCVCPTEAPGCTTPRQTPDNVNVEGRRCGGTSGEQIKKTLRRSFSTPTSFSLYVLFLIISSDVRDSSCKSDFSLLFFFLFQPAPVAPPPPPFSHSPRNCLCVLRGVKPPGFVSNG